MLWADSNTSVSPLFVICDAFGKNSVKTLELWRSFSSKNEGGGEGFFLMMDVEVNIIP